MICFIHKYIVSGLFIHPAYTNKPSQNDEHVFHLEPTNCGQAAILHSHCLS